MIFYFGNLTQADAQALSIVITVMVLTHLPLLALYWRRIRAFWLLFLGLAILGDIFTWLAIIQWFQNEIKPSFVEHGYGILVYGFYIMIAFVILTIILADYLAAHGISHKPNRGGSHE